MSRLSNQSCRLEIDRYDSAEMEERISTYSDGSRIEDVMKKRNTSLKETQ